MSDNPGSTGKTKYLKDYEPPTHLIENVNLTFDLDSIETVVSSKLIIKKNPISKNKDNVLILNGEELTTLEVKLNNSILKPSEYKIENNELHIPNFPQDAILETKVKIQPEKNTALEGLYGSGDILLTQCEAEGFRRITWFMDKPDVLAKYFVTLIADKTRYPVLLSNGNHISSKDLPNNKHMAEWEDPFAKPCYIFALVAGKLDKITDYHTTPSGRKITLNVYATTADLPRTKFAMECLKNAMRWDEQKYGLECDLNLFQLVSAAAFNAGAMENKGLNIYNSVYMLVDQKTGTDLDFENVDRVIAHEYFHNYTGNRVTCRDWFQLSLKEGLTCYRDHCYAKDTYSKAIVRIRSIVNLRARQFPEDSGPGAHPVRPESYLSIDNFYTTTVYEKGQEVIGMYNTLVGEENFIKGVQNYLKVNDGKAATVEDFIAAHEHVSKVDLSQFKLWYSQPGRPEVSILDKWNPTTKEYTINVKQYCPPTKNFPEKKPFLIPMRMGLIDKNGKDIPLVLKGENPQNVTTDKVIKITKEEEEFVFVNINEEPIPSYFRGFSAPITLKREESYTELEFRSKFDSDPFNRWEAAQQMGVKAFNELVKQIENKQTMKLNPKYMDVFHTVMDDNTIDDLFKTEMLKVPTLTFMETMHKSLNLDAWIEAYKFMEKSIAETLESKFYKKWSEYNKITDYILDGENMGKRSLKNLSLHYLMKLNKPEYAKICVEQYNKANNMNDKKTAMYKIANSNFTAEKSAVLKDFYAIWQNDPTIMRTWFQAQAWSEQSDTLENVKNLQNDPVFNIKIPNLVSALVGSYASIYSNFHKINGEGYKFLGEFIYKFDEINPARAANLCSAFFNFDKYGETRKQLMLAEVNKILAKSNLSDNCKEMLERITKK